MQFDDRLTALGIALQNNPTAQWKLNAAVYQDDTQAQGNHIILFTVLDENGMPRAGVNCFVDWVGRDPTDPPTQVVTDSTGQGNVPIYANLDITKKNGPYFAYIEKQSISDTVTGMGLPEHHHVNFLLTFAPQAATPPPPPPPPTQTLHDAALAAVQAVTWMPVNNTGALWKFAKANNLQDQQTNEISFTYNGEPYVAQVFNLGIVYAKKGEWGNIQVIRK